MTNSINICPILSQNRAKINYLQKHIIKHLTGFPVVSSPYIPAAEVPVLSEKFADGYFFLRLYHICRGGSAFRFSMITSDIMLTLTV
jgi:hypothetical protein